MVMVIDFISSCLASGGVGTYNLCLPAQVKCRCSMECGMRLCCSRDETEEVDWSVGLCCVGT